MPYHYKKILTAGCILALLAGLFWQYLWGALVFHKLQAELEPQLHFTSYTLSPVSFTSTERFFTDQEPHRIYGLSVPITFSATPDATNPNWLVGDTKSVGIFPLESDDIITKINQKLGSQSVDRTTVCTLLSHTYSKQSCTTNFELYRAYLALTMTDLGLFTPAKQQQAFYQLLLVKNASEASNHGYEFETAQFKGFLMPIDNDSFKATLFRNDTDSQEIIFNGFTKDEVLVLLANTTSTN